MKQNVDLHKKVTENVHHLIKLLANLSGFFLFTKIDFDVYLCWHNFCENFQYHFTTLHFKLCCSFSVFSFVSYLVCLKFKHLLLSLAQFQNLVSCFALYCLYRLLSFKTASYLTGASRVADLEYSKWVATQSASHVKHSSDSTKT